VSDNLQVNYLRLDALEVMKWEQNPKLHVDNLLDESIEKFGFNDPIGVDYEHSIIVEGHGRIERLRNRKSAGKPAPKNIVIDGADGEWIVPTVELSFADKNAAYLYAIAHNRSNTKDFHLEDYKTDKLATMREAGQLDLLGFETLGQSATMPKFELPELKPFDASSLPDAPGTQIVAPQSFVVMITFPTYNQMREALCALTYGERKSLPQGARLCSIEGGAILARWNKDLMQISISAPIVEATQTGMLGVPDTKVPVIFWDTPTEPGEPKSRGKEKPTEVGGLCTMCGGSKFTMVKNEKFTCPQCSRKGEL